ncbi:MAG: metal-dependent hydrolase [Saprospiraceae bacterium]|nr:metal-dependent hydrolase [Saprospiraceae bacterium]
MKITYCGHSTILLQTGGKSILIDPFLSDNELVQKARKEKGDPAHLDPDRIVADYILISHGHGDHVADAKAIAKRTGAKIISTYEIVNWFGEKDIDGHPMNHGGKWKFDFGTVKFVNAIHSSVLPDGTYGGNPTGIVIWNEEGCVYFAGDTALTMDMKLLPRICPPIDLAILPIGDNFTMGYGEAVIASDFIECDRVLGCHYDTFGYIEIDHDTAKKAFEDSGKELILLPIGDSLDV